MIIWGYVEDAAEPERATQLSDTERTDGLVGAAQP